MYQGQSNRGVVMKFGKQGDLEHINPRKIKPNEDRIGDSSFRNARVTLNRESMASTKESIRKLGLLKPLVVRPLRDDPDGYLYQLVCGSRRLRIILKLIAEAEAILKEGRDFLPEELCYQPETGEWKPATEVYAKVKAFPRECDDETAIRINLAENLEHSKLPDLDLMDFCQELVNTKNADGSYRYKRSEVAEMCGRSESWISLTLDLNKLPERVKNLMHEDRLTRTAALAFLQTKPEKIDAVIEASENIIREEKLCEIRGIEEEIKQIQVKIADAQNDMEIHEMLGNTDMQQLAKKRINSNQKRMSVASEKMENCSKELKQPKLTADAINKANLNVPDAKTGAPKTMSGKEIKSLYEKFKEYRKETQEETEIIKAINSVFEVILGHKSCEKFEEIVLA